MIKLLEEIDELLCYLEDTAHGEEGKRITEMRYKILTELSNSHKHDVSGKRPSDFLNWTRDNFCPIGGDRWVKENWQPSDEVYSSEEVWELFMAACANAKEGQTGE